MLMCNLCTTYSKLDYNINIDFTILVMSYNLYRKTLKSNHDVIIAGMFPAEYPGFLIWIGGNIDD